VLCSAVFCADERERVRGGLTRHPPLPGVEAEEGKWEGCRGPAQRAPGGGGEGGVR
jgi:hypothetical protein